MGLTMDRPVRVRDYGLYNGDRMTQREFHELYEQTPEDFRAELIGGIVYVSSPLKLSHGGYHLELGYLLVHYKAATPGVEAVDNATTILSEADEPQPDLSLRILAEFGGQSRGNADDYLSGAPEMVMEVAQTSRAIDLHAKKRRYEEAGVLEYIVLCVKPKEIHRFCLKGGELTPVPSDDDGILRSQVFPGLWIDATAILKKDSAKALATLEKGLASPEHQEFVRQLQARRRPDASAE